MRGAPPELDDIVIDLDEIDRLAAAERAAKAARRMPPELEWPLPSPRENFPIFRPQFGGPVRAMPEFCEIPGCLSLAAVLDHCHETGRFRGWLCSSCNLRLGRLGDTLASVRAEAEIIQGFVTYMEAFDEQPPWDPPPQLRRT